MAAIPSSMKPLFSGKRLDAAFLLSLCVIACFQAVSLLWNWSGPAGSLTNELYIPAVCFAQGRGFINIAVEEAPGLRDFLDFKTPSLEAGACAAAKPCSWTVFQQYHRYLNYYVGVFWRLFGTTWTVMKIPIVVLFAVFILLNYGIFRLALSPWLSFLLTCVLLGSNATDSTLAVVRDFAKGPFFLAVILLLGMLLRRPGKPARLIWFGVAAGLIVGAGLGFRRDLGVSVPIVLFILLGCRCLPARYGLVYRSMAGALFLAAFTLTAWPILVTFHNGGTLGPHDILMGFEPRCEHSISLEKSMYEKMSLGNDSYIDAMALSVEGIKRHILEPDGLQIPFNETGFLFDLARTFPADMVARIEGAILSILKGDCAFYVNQGAEHPFVFSFGPFLALAVLAILAAWDIRTAFLAAVTLFYFCGYTSLQMHYRHCFHLGFVHLWIAGFFLQFVFRARCALRSGEWTWAMAAKRAKSAGALCALVLAAFAAPLLAATLWQARSVEALWDRWNRATLVDIPYSSRNLGDWTLFDVKDALPKHPCAQPGVAWNYGVDYFAADFSADGADLFFWLKYEAETPENDFSQLLRFPTKDVPAGTRIRCFFPVFDCFLDSVFIRFTGVAAPTENAARFQGIRHADPREFPLLVCAALPEKRDDFRWRQPLCLWGVPDFPKTPRQYETPSWFEEQLNAWRSMDRGALETALAIDPPNLMLANALATLEETGHPEKAAAIRLEALRRNPTSPIAYHLQNKSSRFENNPEGKAAFWESLAKDASCPCVCAVFQAGLALAEAHKNAEALAALRNAWAQCPGEPDVARALSELLLANQLPEEALAIGGAAMKNSPDNIPLLLAWARILAETGRPEEAAETVLGILRKAPEFFLPYNVLNEVLTKTAPEKRAEICRGLVERYPDSPFAAKLLGYAFDAQQQFDAAAEQYIRVSELNPKDTSIAVDIGEALLKGGHPAEALPRLREAVNNCPSSEYPQQLLASALKELGRRDEALETVRAFQRGGGTFPPGFVEWIEQTPGDGK